jgi:hypothetical protein
VGMSRNKLIPLPMCNKHFLGPSEDVMDGQVVKVGKKGITKGLQIGKGVRRYKVFRS